MSKVLTYLGILIVMSLSAGAEELVWDGQASAEISPLPSDLGPTSIDASRRAVRAEIQDWTDDRQAYKTKRVLACALASAETGLLGAGGGAIVGAVQTFQAIEDLGRYLSADGQPHGPSAPLYSPLSELAQTVPFTPAERSKLGRLMSREVQDTSDRIRLAIDTQSFLIQVSDRLYTDQIDEHLQRTEGFLGFFRANSERCSAYSLTLDRDENLIVAGNRILTLYDFLEKELAD